MILAQLLHGTAFCLLGLLDMGNLAYDAANPSSTKLPSTFTILDANWLLPWVTLSLAMQICIDMVRT